MSNYSPSEIKFSGPGIYHIKVIGEVSDEIWDYFTGETKQVRNIDGQMITSLKIHVRDQSELAGLIKLLYDWRVVLVLVKMEGQFEAT